MYEVTAQTGQVVKRAHRLEDAALQEGNGVGVVLLLSLAVQLVRAAVAHLGQRQGLHKRLTHVRLFCAHSSTPASSLNCKPQLSAPSTNRFSCHNAQTVMAERSIV
jgi:hypothetical protein